jgi:hypothetical protein
LAFEKKAIANKPLLAREGNARLIKLSFRLSFWAGIVQQCYVMSHQFALISPCERATVAGSFKTEGELKLIFLKNACQLVRYNCSGSIGNLFLSGRLSPWKISISV